MAATEVQLSYGEKDMLENRLFPQLKGKWGTINLSEIAIDLAPLLGCHHIDKNPFLDPDYCGGWVNFLHKVKGVDYSWGGYLEDRSVIWRGHYHEQDTMTHLGIDFFVPANTKVHMPVSGHLIHSEIDEKKHGGWGGKLIFECPQGYFILGHLKDIADPTGEYVQGDLVGIVAESDANGGWSPHLHVQCMRELNEDVDGYGKIYDKIETDFPNPVFYL